MSDTTDSPDPIVIPNTEDPRRERLLEDGVDIDSPHFDAEADAAERDEEPADAASEPEAAPAETTPADTGKAPKTGSIPKQSAPASDSSTDTSTK